MRQFPRHSGAAQRAEPGIHFCWHSILHRTQVETGFFMTPWPLVVAIMAPIGGRLSDRHPAGLLGGIGLVILGIGMALLATLPASPSILNIVWRMSICGLGFGFFQTPNLRAIMSSAPSGRSGGASGIVATARLTGQSSGAALAALCFALAGHDGATMGPCAWGGICRGRQRDELSAANSSKALITWK